VIEAIPPYEWVQYCSTYPGQPCHLGRAPDAQEAAVLNLVINEGIESSLEDGPSTWRTFPPDRKGACTDYALTKRAALIAFGASPDAVSIVTGEAVYPDGRRFFHVVIEYRTTQGTYILDNLSPDIYAPTARPYQWTEEARQKHGQLYWSRKP